MDLLQELQKWKQDNQAKLDTISGSNPALLSAMDSALGYITQKYNIAPVSLVDTTSKPAKSTQKANSNYKLGSIRLEQYDAVLDTWKSSEFTSIHDLCNQVNLNYNVRALFPDDRFYIAVFGNHKWHPFQIVTETNCFFNNKVYDYLKADSKQAVLDYLNNYAENELGEPLTMDDSISVGVTASKTTITPIESIQITQVNTGQKYVRNTDSALKDTCSLIGSVLGTVQPKYSIDYEVLMRFEDGYEFKEDLDFLGKSTPYDVFQTINDKLPPPYKQVNPFPNTPAPQAPSLTKREIELEEAMIAAYPFLRTSDLQVYTVPVKWGGFNEVSILYFQCSTTNFSADVAKKIEYLKDIYFESLSKQGYVNYNRFYIDKFLPSLENNVDFLQVSRNLLGLADDQYKKVMKVSALSEWNIRLEQGMEFPLVQYMVKEFKNIALTTTTQANVLTLVETEFYDPDTDYCKLIAASYDRPDDNKISFVEYKFSLGNNRFWIQSILQEGTPIVAIYNDYYKALQDFMETKPQMGFTNLKEYYNTKFVDRTIDVKGVLDKVNELDDKYKKMGYDTNMLIVPDIYRSDFYSFYMDWLAEYATDTRFFVPKAPKPAKAPKAPKADVKKLTTEYDDIDLDF